MAASRDPSASDVARVHGETVQAILQIAEREAGLISREVADRQISEARSISAALIEGVQLRPTTMTGSERVKASARALSEIDLAVMVMNIDGLKHRCAAWRLAVQRLVGIEEVSHGAAGGVSR